MASRHLGWAQQKGQRGKDSTPAFAFPQQIGIARRQELSNDRDRTVIVAMAAMRVVQMAVDDVVDMGNRLVPAAWPMNMTRRMPRTGMSRRALIRIGSRDIDRMLFNRAIRIGMVQVPVMHIVDMTGMLNFRVTAGRAMLMRVPFVTSASHSRLSFWS